MNIHDSLRCRALVSLLVLIVLLPTNGMAKEKISTVEIDLYVLPVRVCKYEDGTILTMAADEQIPETSDSGASLVRCFYRYHFVGYGYQDLEEDYDFNSFSFMIAYSEFHRFEPNGPLFGDSDESDYSIRRFTTGFPEGEGFTVDLNRESAGYPTVHRGAGHVFVRDEFTVESSQQGFAFRDFTIFATDPMYGSFLVDGNVVMLQPGDLNRDGNVNVDDLMQFLGKSEITMMDGISLSMLVGSQIGDDDTTEILREMFPASMLSKPYQVEADMNQDGNVDIHDLIKLIEQAN